MKIFFCISLFFNSIISFAQEEIPDNRTSAFLISAGYSYDFPFGDLKKRFGNNSEVGISLGIKTKKNWWYGLGASFLFGETVNEPNLFSSLITSDGNIIGSDGRFSEISIFERGLKFKFVEIGKIFSIGKKKPNSGIIITSSLGLLQHKIQIEDITKTAVQLEGDLKKGYDRLSNGIAIIFNAGYFLLEPYRWLNGSLSMEITYAFTQSRRSFNYDSRSVDSQLRNDILFGLKVEIFVPVFKEAAEKFYYY